MAPSPAPDLVARKRALRREMCDLRAALAEADRCVRAQSAAARLVALPELAALPPGATVAAYAASKGEIDPAPALTELAARGVHAALPRVTGDARRLRFHRLADGVALEAGRFGLREPPESAPEVAPGDFAAILLPGVAFDAGGGRLGMGGGFYDCVLAGLPEGRRPVLIGLAYDFQIVDQCPLEAGDLPVDVVVTDVRVLRAPAAGGRRP
jgi:5-formyltetrahydrofolate cyclo-ligase